jgi:kynurenine formamidase
VKTNPNYALKVADIEAWEKKHGRIPEGSVVFVRSDWSKAWPDPKLATLKEFPRRRARRAEIPARGAQDPVPRA